MSDRSEVMTSGYSCEQIELLKRTVAVGASDDELALFLMRCKRTGLDPFANQIFFTKRKGRPVIQTGIDGLLAIADDTAKLAGIDEPEYFGEGIWQNGRTFPLIARVTVWKFIEGQRVSFTASARWEEYYPGDNDPGNWMWQKMPFGQLGKCALAKALRLGFPQPLGGLYSSEELDQARDETAALPARTVNRQTSPPVQQPKPDRPAIAPPADVQRFNELLRAAGKKWLEVVEYLKPTFPTLTPQTKFKDVPAEALKSAERWLNTFVPAGPDSDPWPAAGESPSREVVTELIELERLGIAAAGNVEGWEDYLTDKGLTVQALAQLAPEDRAALRADLDHLKRARDAANRPPGD